MGKSLTAEDIIERLRTKVGATWMGGTSESFQSGDGNTIVTGIATVWTPTVEILKKAAAAHHNFVLAMEPPFWHETGTVATEAIMGRTPEKLIDGSSNYAFKKKLVDDLQVTIWRFDENYRTLAANPRLNGLARTLGYKDHEDPAATKKLADTGAGVYELPEISLIDLAKNARERADAKALRVLGEPTASIRRVALLPGYMSDQDMMAMAALKDIDAVVCGESCEWEGFVYCEDWITAGWGKGLIMLGRAASEDPGQLALAEWMKSFVNEVPVTGYAVGEPFNYVPSHKA